MLKRHRLAFLLSTVLLSSPVLAVDRTYELRIPQQSLQEALTMFARQSGLEIVYESSLVAGRTSPEVRGTLTAEQVLQRLLDGTGLESRFINAGAIALSPSAEASVQEGGAGQGASPGAQPAISDDPPLSHSLEAGGAESLGSVVVTGTRIRGGATPSPAITIGAERIREEGFSDLGEVIRSIPQNFAGGQNPEVGSGGLSGAGAGNRNVTGGSGLNLRGLGPDATLTLLNGRRPSYSGTLQAVDISAIPVDAVDRVEIVADGASAIYGSDAVGGVGNVILRRDFEGLTAGVRYGVATDGGLGTREYTATAGTVWDSGGWIGTWKRSSVDPIYASQRSYTRHLVPPTTIYPGSDLRSGLVSGHQRLGDRTELRIDALAAKRGQDLYYEYFGTNRIQSETTSGIVSPSIEVALENDWTLTFAGSWSRDEHEGHQTITDAPSIATTIDNRGRSYEVGAEGPLFSVGGGDVRLAIGAGYRWNDFRLVNRSTATNTVEGEESARFAYAEMAMPLIGPDARRTSLQRLELTAAVRGEDYRTVGNVVTPKFGAVFGPSRDVTLKTSWGKSFKAPTLNERYSASVAYLLPPGYFGGAGYGADDAALYVGGGNPFLKPERARTWTTTIAFHPVAMPGLEVELAYFDIDYRDRVIEPIRDITQAMSNPNFGTLIEYDPSAQEQARVLAGIDQFFNFMGVPYDPDNVAAIIDGRRANVARQRIKGLDLSGAYRFALGGGQMTVRGSTSWMDSVQQNVAGQAPYDLSGTLFNPARVNSRIGAVWRNGGTSVSAFASYTGGVMDEANARRTASFTTVDATVRHEFDQGVGPWSNVDVALSMRNLLDRAPPLHQPALAMYAAPYDGTNYSAVGRFLSLSISKHF